jgi:hypothetical protein
VLGHESLGRVIDPGPATRFKTGDLVVGIVRRPDSVPGANCAVGEWDMCRNGQYTERGIKQIDGFMAERWRVEPEYAATVTTLAVSARLGPSSKLYDPEVSDGKILVGVENPPETKGGDLEAALSAAPGAQIKRRWDSGAAPSCDSLRSSDSFPSLIRREAGGRASLSESEAVLSAEPLGARRSRATPTSAEGASLTSRAAASPLGRLLRLQLSPMARVTRDPTQHRLLWTWNVIREVLLVQCVGHFDHLARLDFPRVVVARKVPFR